MTVDRTAPVVTRRTPDVGAEGLALSAVVEFALSEAVDPATVTASSVRLTGPAGPLPATVSLSSDGKVVQLRPTIATTALPLIAFVEATGVTDLAGNALDAPRYSLGWSHFMRLPTLTLLAVGSPMFLAVDELGHPYVAGSPREPDAGRTAVSRFIDGGWEVVNRGVPTSLEVVAISFAGQLGQRLAFINRTTNDVTLVAQTFDGGSEWIPQGTVHADVGSVYSADLAEASLVLNGQLGSQQITFGAMAQKTPVTTGTIPWTFESVMRSRQLVGAKTETNGDRRIAFSDGAGGLAQSPIVPGLRAAFGVSGPHRVEVLKVFEPSAGGPSIALEEYWPQYDYQPNAFGPAAFTGRSAAVVELATGVVNEVWLGGRTYSVSSDNVGFVATAKDFTQEVWPYQWDFSARRFAPTGPPVLVVPVDHFLRFAALQVIDPNGGGFVWRRAVADIKPVRQQGGVSRFEVSVWVPQGQLHENLSASR